MLAGGLLLGLAVGTRLSYLLLIVPCLISLYFFERKGRRSFLKDGSLWVGGFVAGLLPSLVLFALAPSQFIFGNFVYPTLNTFYRTALGFPGPTNPMSLVDKLSYVWNNVLAQPGNLLLFTAVVFFGFNSGILDVLRKQRLAENSLLLLSMPLLLIGALLPTPSWYQYFYALVPFAILLAAFGLSRLMSQAGSQKQWLLLLFVQFVLLANLYHPQDYRRIPFLRYPELWRPVQFHQVGSPIAELSGAGKVLTLRPTYALEGGAQVYPQFATGVFAWRVAPFLSPEQRQAFALVSPAELESFLSADPPWAVLVGMEVNWKQISRPMPWRTATNSSSWLPISSSGCCLAVVLKIDLL
jgi:hypothetical protein